jgi:hypothetical protein
MRPPRFLWVPFEFGRPFGAPGDAAFQTKVLRALLALLVREDGPVVLEDFPEDAPAAPEEDDGAGWACPINLPKPQAAVEPAMLDETLREIARLAPWHAYSREARGRSTFGVTGLEIEGVARFLHAFFDGAPENPVAAVSLGEALRHASEDLRSWYLEAAAARPGAGSRALADWFWGETAAGRMLLALQPVCAQSADAGVRHVALSQFVPRAQRHRQA